MQILDEGGGEEAECDNEVYKFDVWNLDVFLHQAI